MRLFVITTEAYSQCIRSVIFV